MPVRDAGDVPSRGKPAPARGPSGWPAPPAGLRLLVPGWAQWGWRQEGRGLALFGSFAAAAAVAGFAWGTPTGLALLAFAFATHVASAADALRQSAFPGLGRLASVAGAAGGLGAGLYAPVLALASFTAWPGVRGGSSPEGYLVNRWAYRRHEPSRDDWVWYRSSPRAAPRLGRVVAAGGQDVEWGDGRLRVDGRAAAPGSPFRSARPPRRLAYRVPGGHVLINPEGGPSERRVSEGLVVVDRGQVVGRAWARYYPVRERRLID